MALTLNALCNYIRRYAQADARYTLAVIEYTSANTFFTLMCEFKVWMVSYLNHHFHVLRFFYRQLRPLFLGFAPLAVFVKFSVNFSSLFTSLNPDLTFKAGHYSSPSLIYEPDDRQVSFRSAPLLSSFLLYLVNVYKSSCIIMIQRPNIFNVLYRSLN